MSAPCEGCTCGRAQGNGLAPPEQQQWEDRQERSFTSPLDWIEPTEGVEPAIPLRSKKWFNAPDDGQFPTLVRQAFSADKQICARGMSSGISTADLRVSHTSAHGHESVLIVSGRNHDEEKAHHWYRPDRIRSRTVQLAPRPARQARAGRYHRCGRHAVRVPLSPDPGDGQASDRCAR